MKTVDIYLSSQEARYGCQKIISLPNQVAPLKLDLESGTRNNTKLVIKNARFYGRNGAITTTPMKVIIHVEQAGNSNDSAKGNRFRNGLLIFLAILFGHREGEKSRWPIHVALLLLVCVSLVISSQINGSRSTSNTGSGSGSGTVSGFQTDTPSSVGQQDSGIVEGKTDGNKTDIPAILLQEGGDSWGAPEYCPKFEFFSDGQFNMWINLGYEYGKVTSTYEVYQYSNGLRAIACDVSSFPLYDPVWGTIYLLESGGGTWDYYGTTAGLTYFKDSFTIVDSATVSALAVSVRDPSLSTGYMWMTEDGADDLIINWVNSGKVSFDLGLYRLYDYTNQTGICASDGAVYCFLDDLESTGTHDQDTDVLIRLTFQADSISLEFLSARESSQWQDYYVGQTYIFR